MRHSASSRHMGEPRPAAGVEPGLLAAGLAMALLLMPAGVCRLIARIRGWDPDPDPTERN